MYQQYQIDKEMLQTARRQFCLDTCLDWQQYLEQPEKRCYIQKTQYKAGSRFPVRDGARQYHGMDSFFKAIMCMGQLFLAVDEQIYDWAVEKFAEYPPEWFCEYGNLRMIDEKLREYGRKINDTHMYFLPVAEDTAALQKVEDAGVWNGRKLSYPYAWYNQEETLRFKENNRFTSAICFSPTQPDMLAVAALREHSEAALMDIGGKRNEIICHRDMQMESEQISVGSGIEMAGELCPGKEFDQSHMAGMAGASVDGEYLWQIGINVVPEYMGRGLAVKLVRQLKEEIIRRGKVPFYGTSESHTVSQSIAIKAGFMPAWTEIYAKSIEN